MGGRGEPRNLANGDELPCNGLCSLCKIFFFLQMTVDEIESKQNLPWLLGRCQFGVRNHICPGKKYSSSSQVSQEGPLEIGFLCIPVQWRQLQWRSGRRWQLRHCRCSCTRHVWQLCICDFDWRHYGETDGQSRRLSDCGWAPDLLSTTLLAAAFIRSSFCPVSYCYHNISWTSWAVSMKLTSRSKLVLVTKLEHGLWRPIVNKDAFSNSTACCFLDFWPPEFDQVISRSEWTFVVNGSVKRESKATLIRLEMQIGMI